MPFSKKTGDAVTYLYCLIVFCLSFNAVNAWFGTGPFYIALVLGVIIPFGIFHSFFSSKVFYLLIIYTIFVLLNYYSGDTLYSKIKFIIQDIACLYISLSLFYYVLMKKRYRFFMYLLFTLTAAVVWTALATQAADMIQPGIVRFVHGELQTGEDSSQFRSLYATGMSEYTLPHAIPILIPIVFLYLKKGTLQVWDRLLGFFVLYCLLALTFFSGASGPMLAVILVTIMSIIVNNNGLRSNYTRLIIVGLISLPFLLSDSLMLGLLDTLSNLLGDESYFQAKISHFQDTIIYGESQGDIAERGDLYSNSFEAFFNNVLIGAQVGMGGHSVMIDRLASLGIIGFLPFAFLLILPIKCAYEHISDNNRIYYVIGVFGALFMLITKGVSLWYMWFFLFTVLPLGIIIVDKGFKNVFKNYG